VTELLAEIGLPEPKRELRVRVTYQDALPPGARPAHPRQPRQLIRALPGSEAVEMAHPDICCGSAGIYNAIQRRMSKRILDEEDGRPARPDPSWSWRPTPAARCS